MRMDTCVCVAESLRCSPETITGLLIGYTPIKKKTSSGIGTHRVSRQRPSLSPFAWQSNISFSTSK